MQDDFISSPNPSKKLTPRCGIRQIGDHEQRRILQGFAVLEELLVGSVEAGVFAFVFQPMNPYFQTSAQPWPPVYLLAPVSKVKNTPLWSISVGVAVEAAEVEEVLLDCGSFFEMDVGAFVDELLGGDGGWHAARSSHG